MFSNAETSNRRSTRALVGRILPGALIVVMLGALPATAVEVSPKTIEFEKIETSETISVVHNGQAVPASAIKSVKLWAGGHDYDHMIDVKKADGQVTVKPSELLEIGSYDLVIDTGQGKATVTVMAPLDKLYTSLESRADRLGITVDELKSRLGMTRQLGQEVVRLNLPKVYYVGQTLSVPMEQVEGRTYAWAVNGTAIQVGVGDARMNYTFTEPGIYDFTYVEKEGDRVVAAGFGATTVVAEPPVHSEVEQNTAQKFVAPIGYSHYVWRIDGKDVAQGDTLTYEFKERGSHVVSLHAHTPVSGNVEALRNITYVVTVM
jgi:hypothetical protein